MPLKGDLLSGTPYLWQPLLEAAAQTLIGAVASYSFSSIVQKYLQRNTFDGAMDFWQRGVHGQRILEGDTVHFDGLVSPYTQLFPGDPLENARRWNALYTFPGKITSAEYQSMEFFAGSDAALRVGSINGETLVGLYSRYGFVGEGIVGVAPTRLLYKSLPDFFHVDFIGARARVTGKLARCPSQHGYVAQAIAQKVGVPIDISGYRNTWYVQITSVKPFKGSEQTSISLLGSAWAATEIRSTQYLVQYGYLSDNSEKQTCLAQLRSAKAWKKARVYFDDIDCPSSELSFGKKYF